MAKLLAGIAMRCPIDDQMEQHHYNKPISLHYQSFENYLFSLQMQKLHGAD
jgi:hypothetical protein